MNIRFISLTALAMASSTMGQVLYKNGQVFLVKPTAPEPAPQESHLALVNVNLDTCQYFDDFTYFDITPLYKEGGYQNGDYRFSFCKSLTINDTKVFNTTDTKAYAYKQTTVAGKNSYIIFGDQGKDTETIQDDNNQRHLKYSMASSYLCDSATNRNYETQVEIFCNPDGTRDDPVSDIKFQEKDKCTLYVSTTHKAGCPRIQATSIVEFFEKNPWLFGIILIVFGVVCTFFGAQFFPYILAFVGGGLAFLLVLLFFSVIGALRSLESKSQKTAGQITATVFAFIVAALIAAVAGWVCKKAKRVGISIMGAAAGFIVGFALYNLIFAQWAHSVALFLIISIVFGGILAVVSWIYDKHCMVYLTAFVGAYSLVRGFSAFFKGYPNEIQMMQELSQGTFQLPGAFYAYLFFFIALTAAGIYVQRMQKMHLHKDERLQGVKPDVYMHLNQ